MPDQSEAPIVRKPCPFCGGEAIMSGGVPNRHAAYVYCSVCGAESACKMKAGDALAVWNARAPEAAEIIRLCEEALEIAQYRECNSRCLRIPLVGHTEYCKKLRAVLAQIKGQNL